MSSLPTFKQLVSFGEAAKNAGTTITLKDAKSLKEGDTITIKDGKVEKQYVYGKDKDFTDMAGLFFASLYLEQGIKSGAQACFYSLEEVIGYGPDSPESYRTGRYGHMPLFSVF